MKKFTLTFFTTRCLFLGLIFSSIIKSSLQDSLISAILGTILGSIIIFVLHKIKNPSKIVTSALCIYFFMLMLIVIQNLVSAYFLVNTPKIVIIIPFILLVIYLASKDYSTIENSSFTLFFIGIGFVITAMISLFGYGKFSNILPLFDNKISSIIYSTLVFAFLSAMPNFIIKDKIPVKKHIIDYIITCVLSIIILYLLLTILTPKVAALYSFPEYMVLKRIKLLSFIENIENIITSLWYIDILIFNALNLKKLYETLNENTLLFYSLIVTTVLFTTFFIMSNFIQALYIYHTLLYNFIIIFLLLIVTKKKA